MERTSVEPDKQNRNIMPFLLGLILFIAALTGQFSIDFSIMDYDPDEVQYDGPLAPEHQRMPAPDDPTQKIFEYVEKRGNQYVLKQHILRKKQEEEDRLARSEQYVLKARTAGYYECPTCVKQYGRMRIYLPAGAILKYGVSTRGEKRYSTRFFREKNCRYETQFVGNYYECLLQEKEKIYLYLISDENMSRDTPLISTPWNSNSN
jgi:hypothetical protein